MDDQFTRFFDNITGRLDGPMKFRFVLQPVIASVFAVLSGLKDAKLGRPPYFWGLVTHPESRADMLRDGWKSVRRIFFLGIAMDVIYQIIVFRRFYPFETLFIAAVLALVPYILIRGTAGRIARGVSKTGAQ